MKKFLAISLIALFSFGHSFAQLATALAFDGTSATVSVPASPSVNISSAITIETWVFPTKNSFGVQDVVCKSSSSVNNGYIFPRFTKQLGSVQFQLNINGYGWQTLEVSYGNNKLNQWHHLAATYDGLTMSIYIDGVLAGSQNFAGTITVNNNPLTIANQPGLSEFFGGKLDETRIWNKALSQCTISNNMNCELSLPQAGLALYYKYNQGIVNGINLGVTTVADSSGNGNTGTLNGFLLTGLLSNWAVGTVSSSSCSAISPITASVAQALVPVGGDINLSATGGGTYSWVGPNGFTSTSQNPLIHGVSTDYSGTYTVTVTNNGCTSTAKVSVTVAWMAGALNFNSLGSKVVIPNSTYLNPAALTIETWINPSNSLPAIQDVISKSSSNTTTYPTPGGYIFPRTEDGWRNFMFRIYINGAWQVLSVPYTGSINQWNHVAATYDGTTMKVYFNGNLVGSLAVTGNITYNNDNLVIGVQDGTSEYYQGSVDETRIWSRALTQCEIQNNISCTLNGANNALAAQNGLSAYFRYDQGLINVDNSAYTTLADSSSHGNNGTLQGFLLNGLTSNWVTGNVGATCSPFVGSQAVAGSNGPNIAVGSTLLLTASTGNSWSWTGPNGFTSTQQNPSITNVQPNASGTYTVTIAGNGCNSSDKTTVTVASPAGSLSFDGVKDMVTVPSNATMKGTKEITIESWIYPTNSTNNVQDVMSKSTTTTANTGFIFPRTDDGWKTLSFYLATGSVYHIMSVPYPGINQWHHVAATYDGFNMRIYIDGSLAGSQEATGALVVNDVPLTLGVQPGFTEYYAGQIDEARFWTKALTQCEIVNDMSCQVNAVQKPGLAVYFRFNQGFVNANNSTVTTVIDSSGNANNGTINNFNLTGSTSNWAPPQVSGACAAYTDPVVTASASASVYAVGSTIQLFGTGGFAGSGGNAYIWDGPNSFNSTTQNPVIANAQTNATGTYTLTAPFINCVIKKSTRLTVSSLNQITANGPVTFCPSSSVVLSIATTGTSYQWYRNSVLIPGATAASYTATQSGDYSVSTTTGTDVLMTAPITVTVVDNLAPVPNVASLPTLNLSTPATVSTIPTATDNCKGNITATTTSQLVYNTPGTYNITWTYNDGNGNTSTQNQTVTVIDATPPVLTVPSNITATGNPAVCGAIANFTATTTDNSGLPVTITYSQNSGTVFPVGTTTVTVTATDASNNITTGTFTITVSPTVVAAITGTTSVCAGSTTTLATTSTGGTWSTNNATVATINASGVVFGLTAGTAVITYTNNCGATASATVTVKALPATPTVTVTDNCGSSILNTTATGTLAWSTGATTASITVSSAGSYSVTQTVNGCASAAGSGTAAPAAAIATPVVTVVNNCGTSTLSTNATGTLAWSTGATTASITVASAGSYSVTQTANGCVSAAGSGTAAPKATPSAPVVTVADNCGTSTLSTSTTGTLAWSTGATTASITVSSAGSYSVIQTVNGCVSAAGSGTASPKATPATPVVTVVNNCGTSTLSTNATGTLLWSTGATTASITVSSAGSYSVTQTVNGCVSAAGSATAAPAAVPSAPVVTVVNNCGTSTLSTNATGTILWSTGATTASITVSSAGSYSVTQTANGCVSAAGSGTAAPKATPSAPVVTVADNCGTSILNTTTTGTLAWSTGATTASITVSSAGSYSVTQTINGCVSAAGSGTAAPAAVPSAPVVTVSDNCGTSTLSTNATGTILWSTGATTASITVSSAGSYSVTQTANGCVSAAGSGTASPKATPATPVVTVVNNCGTSTLSTNATGTLAWSTGAATASITVSSAGSYSVTQTVNGCVSAAGSGTASPKATPAAPVVTVVNNCGTSTLSTNATGTLAWSTGAATASITVSSAGSYSVTQTVNGCVSAAGSGTAVPNSYPTVPAITGTTSVNIGSTTQLADATTGGVWSSNSTNATVNASGLVTAVTGGTATISYTVTNGTGCATVVTTVVTVSGCIAPAFSSSIANISTNTSVGQCSAAVTYAATLTGTPAPTTGYTFTGATTGTGSGTGSGSAFNVGVTTVVIKAANACGTVSTSFTITVKDVTPPNAVTKNITASLDANGQVTITPSMVDNGSNDNCGAVTVAFQCAAASQNFVTNGDLSSNANGWTLSNVDAVGGWKSTGGASGGGYVLLNSNGDAATDPTMKQTLTGLTVGQWYTISGMRSNVENGAYGNPSALSFGVTVDNTVLLQLSNTNGSTWVPFSVQFKATATSHVLYISAERNGDDTQYGIDNVSVTASTANLVVNGDLTSNANSWTLSNVDAVGGWKSSGGCTGGGYVLLNSNGDAATDPTMKQTLTGLVPGQWYTISGMRSNVENGAYGNPSALSFGVAIDNTVLLQQSNTNGSTWIPFSIQFKATATSQVLYISAERNGDDTQYGIDNVSVVGSAAPASTSSCTVNTISYNCSYLGQNTVTLVVTDANGNVSTGTAIVTVQDNTAPVVTAPADITISCGGSTAPTSCGGSATATDNCSSNVTITYSDVTSGSVITRTWKGTDANGNSGTDIQIITMVDNVKPVITDIADVTVTCGGSTAPSSTGTPTATDNCSTPTVTYTDVINGNTTTRTWKATDASGNYATSTQVITMVSSFSVSVTSVPTNNTYTGGICTNLYLGYGAQSTTLQLGSLSSLGAPYTYNWSGSAKSMLNSSTSSAPVFTPTANGYYTFTVTVTNKYGCSASTSISICVTDVRVPNCNGAYVYLTHTSYNWWGSSYTQTVQVYTSQVCNHIQYNTCGGGGNCRLGSTSQSPCGLTANSVVNAPIAAVTTNSATKEGTTDAATTEEELKITVMPNPSTTYFTLKFESKYETPISMRVMDAGGRVVDAQSKIGSNSTIQVGANYASGTYYAEMIQGTQRKVIQLMKVK